MMRRLAYIMLATVATAAIAYPMSAAAGQFSNRLVNQQKRVYNGVSNGSLTPSEYANIQRREASIDRQRRHFLKTGGGLQPWERGVLDYRLDNTSRAIYRNKHD